MNLVSLSHIRTEGGGCLFVICVQFSCFLQPEAGETVTVHLVCVQTTTNSSVGASAKTTSSAEHSHSVSSATPVVCLCMHMCVLCARTQATYWYLIVILEYMATYVNLTTDDFFCHTPIC